MVAITVILAAVIASFVLGLGDTDDPAPNIVFEDSFDATEEKFEISITSGDSDADASKLRVVGDEIDAAWNDDDEIHSAGEDTLRAGQSITLSVNASANVNYEEEILLIWDGDDQLQSFEVPEDPNGS